MGEHLKLDGGHSGLEVKPSSPYALNDALANALFNKPHDRQFILELENSVVSFLDSNAQSFELRPMNSYYRLLAHQIAEYYNLKHTLIKAHNNSLVLYKGDDFKRENDKCHLQDLEPPFGNAEVLAQKRKPKKYTLLKRDDSEEACDSTQPIASPSASSLSPTVSTDFPTKSDYSSSEASLEQERIRKEKEYEQRKQAIFEAQRGQEKDVAADNSDSANEVSDSDEEDYERDHALNTPERKKPIMFETFINDSPQPHQFETSRYRFKDQQDQPRSWKNKRNQNGYRSRGSDDHGYNNRRYHQNNGYYQHDFGFNINAYGKGFGTPAALMPPSFMYPQTASIPQPTPYQNHGMPMMYPMRPDGSQYMPNMFFPQIPYPNGSTVPPFMPYQQYIPVQSYPCGGYTKGRSHSKYPRDYRAKSRDNGTEKPPSSPDGPKESLPVANELDQIQANLEKIGLDETK